VLLQAPEGLLRAQPGRCGLEPLERGVRGELVPGRHRVRPIYLVDRSAQWDGDGAGMAPGLGACLLPWYGAAGTTVQISTTTLDWSTGHWRYSTWRPPHLADTVELMWESDGVAAETEDRHYPSPSVELLVNVSGDRYRLLAPDGAEFFDDAWLAGVQVGPVVCQMPRRSVVLGVRLRPAGAYALLGLPMREVCGFVANLEDLVGAAARELTARCRNAGGVEARFRVAASWVAERVSRARGITPEVAWSEAQIERTGGAVPIAHLRSETGWSKTRLVAAFRDQIGVAPKLYARIVRFSRAAELLSAGGALTDVALAAGYYDQPHMNAEFRELSGLTPRAFAACEYLAS
jgi:methylphosphotriester-DNA--protein-cysteine methyltransferase